MTTARAMGLFTAITVAVILVGGWVLTLVYPGADARRAVVASAGVAFVVQLVAFAVARRAAVRKNPVAGWGLGALLRMGVFAVYALVVVRALGLASVPAMISLAVFFFVSTLVEPLLLNV
ncbi:hypothetical protein [Roseisolibacter sp. H3M3-2]|uniref:hypothetical protein n=1 Tax=Roseisolibacter sp. H3M3-2 TaxID=3031323 RepID=UPI0023DADB14|nr:hypothetical protein [Roseisolibacter sp. H3M3-2]MDF1501432.1 hypothetical protein [Roseisolibacter sp. H3M3-2]